MPTGVSRTPLAQSLSKGVMHRTLRQAQGERGSSKNSNSVRNQHVEGGSSRAKNYSIVTRFALTGAFFGNTSERIPSVYLACTAASSIS